MREDEQTWDRLHEAGREEGASHSLSQGQFGRTLGAIKP